MHFDILTLQKVFLLFLTILLLACSRLPTEDDAKFALRQVISRESGNKMQLISFKKMNAQERESDGVEYYVIEYEAEIEFKEDCKWLLRGSSMNEPPRSFKTGKTKKQAEAESGFWGGWMNLSMQPGKEYRKGEHDKFTSYLVFEETENGWRIKNK